ncbi:DUF5958 family protein [Spirosoma sp. KNUC1025]|uniref:DUF5958 family protein n=1 Tax=Spirosoma sp. KNUC1025 TaxID=2894082 RepID=UPI003864DAAB|nr:DUF5958 family protein [Spirosoma sp. KNUC1025]
MSIEEQIKIIQFGQGICPEAELLEQLDQLDESEKGKQVFDLYVFVSRLKPADADIGQAIADADIGPDYSPCISPKSGTRKVWRKMFSEHPEKDYMFLLRLFKIDYQRRYALNKDNATNWQYRDLSNRETVEAILKQYENLVEEVYQNPSFRSEFVCIAKLWHERSMQPPTQIRQDHYTYLTYDELLTESIKLLGNLQIHPISMLCHSIEQALSIKYGLDHGLANRLTLEVIDRHMRETYNSSIYK